MTSVKKQMIAASLLILVFSGSIAKLRNETATRRPDPVIKKTGWLIGEWENKSPRRTSYESWSVKNDSVYCGKSYFIKDGDTVIMERISLEQHSNDLFYIPTVNGQSNNEPVSFKMTTITETQVVFENQAHDFPQKIVYTQVTKDSLLAAISGVINGQKRSRAFPMRRLK